MIQLVRTNSANPDFVELIKKLDQYLSITDGDDHAFYDQFNKINTINHVIITYIDEKPVGCGAIKEYDYQTMEIKRMFTIEEIRGKGIASMILAQLESWTIELAYKKCILETGVRQIEAIGLYKKNNYKIIENYGQYTGVEGSICFEKNIL